MTLVFAKVNVVVVVVLTKCGLCVFLVFAIFVFVFVVIFFALLSLSLVVVFALSSTCLYVDPCVRLVFVFVLTVCGLCLFLDCELDGVCGMRQSSCQAHIN